MSRPVTKSAPVKAAWRKGFSAGRRQLPETANPYLTEEHPTVESLIGWSRLYAKTWHDGWVDGQAGG